MGSHLQSHVTHQCRDHVTNQKRYIFTFTRPTDPKLCRVVAQDEEISSTKSHDTSTTWSREKSKNFISLISQGLWNPNLAGWWLKMIGLHPQNHVRLRYCGHMTNKKRYISPFTRPMDPKLSQFVTQDTGTHTNKVMWHIDHMVRWQIKTVLSPHSHRPWPAKLGRVLTQDEGAPPKKSRDTSIVWSNGKSKTSYFLNHRTVEM